MKPTFDGRPKASDTRRNGRTTGRSNRRRKLLASGLVAGLFGTMGCLGRQTPKAAHWAAGIGWSDPPEEIFAEIGFSAEGGSVFTGPTNPKHYLRINNGKLIELRAPTVDSSVPAERGDHVEYVIDFDAPRQGKEVIFEYTIPDEEELVGVLAGFAECRHYEGTDEWTVRPLNVDLDGREETLVVTVRRERGDENPDWYVWGHDESTRNDLRDRAAPLDAEVDIKFVDPGVEATFGPSAFHRVGMGVFDGGDKVARVWYPEPDADS